MSRTTNPIGLTPWDMFDLRVKGEQPTKIVIPKSRYVRDVHTAAVGDKGIQLGKGFGLRRSGGNVVYTCPGNAKQTIIRKVILTNRGITDVSTGGYGTALARVLVNGEIIYDARLLPGEHIVFEPNLVMSPYETLAIREIVEMTGSAATMTNLISGNSATDTTAYTTASWTAAVDGLYHLSVASSKASAPDFVSSVTDSAARIAWDLLDQEVNVTNNVRVSTFRGRGTSAGSGTTTINFGATQTGAVWSISRLDNGCLVGVNGEEAFQEASGKKVAPNVANIQIPASPWTGGAHLALGTAGASGSSTPGHGTELSDSGNAEAATLMTMYDMVPRSIMWATWSTTPVSPVGMVTNLQDTRAPHIFMAAEGVETA